MDAASALRAGNAAPLAAILNSDSYVFEGGALGESFKGYALDDTLYGNGGNDTLDGAGGNDQIFGGDGADSLLGGAGLDSIYGGAENDTVRGGSEADYVLAGDGSDTVWGDEGNDLIYGGLGVDALIGGTGSDTLYGDEGEDELQGDWGGDALYGGDGADRLYGDLALDGAPFGNDTLDGGLGRDTLWGGGGDDLYAIGDLTQSGNLLLYDVIVELPNAGIDTVYLAPGALGTYTLPDNVENLAILGAAAMNAIGNGLDNQLTGNGFANALTGGAGFDTLDGGQGYDTLVGGTGNDVYVLADTNSVAGLISLAYDQVVENAGGGFDTIRIARAPQSIQDRPPPLSPIITYWTSFTLPAEIEAGEVIGTDAFDLTGNEVANRLTGNGAANALLGMAGSDSVFGMGGDDVLNGGEGADTLDGGEGVDWASYAFDTQVVAANLFGGLAVQNAGQPGATVDSLAFIENIFGGNAGDFLIGNDVANRLEGGFGGDNLWGYGGADTLLGGDGDDIVVGGEANDSLESGLGQDWLYGQGGNDTLRGTDATANAFNVLVGGDGDDMLIAGPTGFDYLYGGDGANRNGDDLFVMAPNSGVKVLVDFEAGGANDEVRLAGTALTSFAQVQANLSFSGTINGMVLVVDAGTQVWFLGATPGQLTAGDFLFA